MQECGVAFAVGGKHCCGVYAAFGRITMRMRLLLFTCEDGIDTHA